MSPPFDLEMARVRDTRARPYRGTLDALVAVFERVQAIAAARREKPQQPELAKP